MICKFVCVSFDFHACTHDVTRTAHVQSKEIEFEVGRKGILSGFAAYMTACLLRKADGEEGPEIPAIQTWVWDEETGKEVCRGDWAQQARFNSCVDEACSEFISKPLISPSPFSPSTPGHLSSRGRL
jgi:hypothetical protein